MKKLFITKENLKVLIGRLKKNCDEFIAPKKEHLDDIIFCDTKEDSTELLDFTGNSVISPRAFLLPQTEILFEIKSARNNRLAPFEDKKKRVFFGVRPCDIKALSLMRRFFLDNPVDEFYKKKLELSTFICLACSKHCSERAFCFEMGSGPYAKDGFDLQFIPVSKGYLVEAGSKKGNDIVKKNKELFFMVQESIKHFPIPLKLRKEESLSPAKGGTKFLEAGTLFEKEAKTNLKNFSRGFKKINYKKLARIMKEDKVKQSIWDDIGERCVICSGCITLCPTCSCFSAVDRIDGDKGMRIRYCDGCPYAGFTRMAGGNIPQPLHNDHIRRYFEHKLNVDVERYATPSCVGCGRCIQACPGNISIHKFIKEVLK